MHYTRTKTWTKLSLTSDWETGRREVAAYQHMNFHPGISNCPPAAAWHHVSVMATMPNDEFETRVLRMTDCQMHVTATVDAHVYSCWLPCNHQTLVAHHSLSGYSLHLGMSLLSRMYQRCRDAEVLGCQPASKFSDYSMQCIFCCTSCSRCLFPHLSRDKQVKHSYPLADIRYIYIDNLFYYTLKNKVCHLWWLDMV